MKKIVLLVVIMIMFGVTGCSDNNTDIVEITSMSELLFSTAKYSNEIVYVHTTGEKFTGVTAKILYGKSNPVYWKIKVEDGKVIREEHYDLIEDKKIIKSRNNYVDMSEEKYVDGKLSLKNENDIHFTFYRDKEQVYAEYTNEDTYFTFKEGYYISTSGEKLDIIYEKRYGRYQYLFLKGDIIVVKTSNLDKLLKKWEIIEEELAKIN